MLFFYLKRILNKIKGQKNPVVAGRLDIHLQQSTTSDHHLYWHHKKKIKY